MCRFGFCCFTLLFSLGLCAQTNVAGAAPVILQVRSGDCDLPARTVDVFVDVTGLIGNGGEAGINGFVLAFNMSDGHGFQSAEAGMTPPLEWTFVATEAALAAADNTLTLVGVTADASAPNGNYHLAAMIFEGADTWVTLEFDENASSLGSRLIDGDGHGPIPMTAPDPISFHLIRLNLGTGLSHWPREAPDYDLAPPFGAIDTYDLVALVNCTSGGRR